MSNHEDANGDYSVKEARVSFTTKELLTRIDDRLDRIETAVGNMPTRPEFQSLADRTVVLELWRATVEGEKKQRRYAFTRRDKIIATVIAMSLLLLNVLQSLHNHGYDNFLGW